MERKRRRGGKAAVLYLMLPFLTFPSTVRKGEEKTYVGEKRVAREEVEEEWREDGAE